MLKKPTPVSVLPSHAYCVASRHKTCEWRAAFAGQETKANHTSIVRESPPTSLVALLHVFPTSFRHLAFKKVIAIRVTLAGHYSSLLSSTDAEAG